MESAVRLIVKAPNQQIEDQVVNCQLDWTIARLKDHLAEVYPSKPKNSEQKLIYSGHLLKDNTCLKDVLRNYEDSSDQSFIVHLVCASNKNMETKTTDKTLSMPNTTTTVTSDSSRQNETGPQTESGVNNAPPLAQVYSVPGFYGQLNSQQIVWMQHAYIQYLSQYMQLMAAQGIQMPNNVPYMQALNDPANGQTNSPNNNNRDNEVAVRARGQEGDAAFDEGDENGLGLDRDWLESFFVFLRVIVLFGIVYLYSSPTRFIIVTLLGFAIHLYQGGFLRVNNQVEENARVDNIARADNANNVRVENNQNQNNNQGNEAPQNDPPVVQATETQPAERTNVNEEHEAERPGALAFTWMFFSSFFASLIPDQPI